MFYLEELSENNYTELSKLKIKDSQKPFVLDFNGCVAYKKKYPFLKIYGIKKDDIYIGLTAFARWDSDLTIPVEERWTWFDEFFFDVKYQHHGYGTEVVNLILKKIEEIYDPKFIILSVRNENEAGKHLYRKLGFIDTNLVYLKDNDDVIKKDILDPHDEFIMYKIVK